MPYPTGEELAAWMVAQRLIKAAPTDLLALDAAMEGAAASLEGDTYWTPFLAGDEETRRFDWQGPTLYPGVGIVSVSALRVGGALLAADADYFLQGRKMGRYAYQSVEFNEYGPGLYGGLGSGFVRNGGRRSVEIVGVFGFAAALPADVRLALLGKAAVVALANPETRGAVLQEDAGPVSYRYAQSVSDAASPSGRFSAAYDDVVARYRRMV